MFRLQGVPINRRAGHRSPLGENPFGIGSIDIKSYYMGGSGCTWEDTRSIRIPAEFKGSSLRHTHDALDDAMEQAELFQRIREKSVNNDQTSGVAVILYIPRLIENPHSPP
jgi:hypothetical protein